MRYCGTCGERKADTEFAMDGMRSRKRVCTSCERGPPPPADVRIAAALEKVADLLEVLLEGPIPDGPDS